MLDAADVERLRSENEDLRRRLAAAERNDHLALLARLGEQLVLREAGARTVVEEVFSQLAASLDFDLFFHYEVHDAPHTLRLVASGGLTDAQRERFTSIRSGEYLCGLVAERRSALVAENLPDSPYAEAAALCAAGVRCYAGVPLLAQGRLVGTVSFASRRRSRIADGERQLIQTVADLAATQIARARSEQRLRERETHLRLAMQTALAVVFEWNVVDDHVQHLHGGSGMTLPFDGDRCRFADVVRLVHPDDREGFRARVAAALASASGEYASSYRLVQPDGMLRWLDERGRVEFDGSGRPLRLLGVAHDVTEYRQAQDALRESEERFRSMADGTPVPIWVTDGDGGIEFVNRAYCEFFGVTQDEVKQRGWTPLVHPDDFAGYVTRFTQALAARASFHGQVRVRHADGEWRWIESFGAPRFSAAGKFLGMAGSSPDVTRTKQAEAALAASEARLQLAMLAGDAATWDLDIATGRNVWSESHFTMLGLVPTPDRVATEGMWRDAVLPEDLPRVLAAWERAERERDVYRCDLRVRRADNGGVIWLQTAGRFEYDAASGKAVRFAGVLFDVTLERTAQRALADSEEQLRLALEASDTGLWTWSPRDGTVTWSPESYRIHGMGPGDFDGSEATFFRLVHAEDRARVERTVRAAIDHGAAYECEFRIVRPDGSVAWVANRGRARCDTDAASALVLGTITDVTQRKQYEVALQQADRRKDEFLAMLAHELRNPLAPIRNAAELLRLGGPQDPAIESARSMIERQVAHMVRLVDDLLDVSRVSRGKIALALDALDLRLVVRQAVETLRPLLDTRRHQLALALAPGPVIVRGDFTRLAQVVGNLLGNAAKYTDPGGRIAVDLASDGEGSEASAVLRVRDSGRGIDAAALPHLFDLFFQADRNLDRAEGGLGIGLALVRTLVEMHGGRVEAHSAGRGHGSEFVVRLPRVIAATEPATAAKLPDTVPRHALRILVVDDNRDSADSTALLLRVDGHDVSTAYDGRRALELAVQQKPEVVLLDLGLPDLDGYAACRAMRAAGLSDTLIVTMTGYGQDEDQRLSREAGFDAHHVKPIELDALRALIASHGPGGGERRGPRPH